MCAPSIIHSVCEDISRRGFLMTLGGAVAAAAVTAPVEGQTQKPLRLAKGFRDVHDLTYTFTAKTPVFPAFKPIQITPKFSRAKDGFFANEITFDEHTGTHMDAPVHFVQGGATADRLPADRFIAPLAVIDIESRASKDADAVMTVDDVLSWEKRHGRLPAGAFVAMYSGWGARIGNPARFLNKDGKGTMHAPGFSEDVAKFLANERDIVGAGVDTLSLDIAAASKFVAHLALLGAGKYGVELLANLNTLPPSGATVVIGGPKHDGASGGPCRVYALV
ncbi:MAG TPA: cyclase family protein [Vicinamibacterales bacterium]|nr:cyclase family protein [Vicinamibacterales bacterium]